jgi:hypothetical protein
MKHFFLLSVVLILMGQNLNAQILNDAFDHRGNAVSRKERKTALIANQQSLILKPLAEKYLFDSSYSYQWDSVNSIWSVVPYRRVKYNYNDMGLVTLSQLWIWQTTTNSWVFDEEYHCVRDTQGNITEWIINVYDVASGKWIPDEHDTLSYYNNILVSESGYFYNKLNNTWFTGYYSKCNNRGALLESYEVYWNEPDYIIQSVYKETHTLNSYDKPIEIHYQEFDKITPGSDYDYKTVSTYQNDTILEKEMYYDWISESGLWDLWGQDLYSYSNLKTEIVKQHLDGTVWINLTKTTSEYYTNNLISKELYQHWNGVEWDSFTQTLYTYNANNVLTEKLGQDYNDGSWVNSRLYAYTFDNNNNQIERLAKFWNTTTGLLTSSSYKYTYSFNANNLHTQTIYQKWSTTNLDWKNNFRTDNYYSLHQVFGLPSILNDDKFEIYPNPVKRLLFINGLTEKATVSIFDVQGKLLLNQQITTNHIDVGNLTCGMYTLKIETKKGTMIKKFVKQFD